MPKGSKPRMQRKANVSKSVCGQISCREPTPTLFSPAGSAEPPFTEQSTCGKTENGRQKELSSHTEVSKKQLGKRNKGLGHGHPF